MAQSWNVDGPRTIDIGEVGEHVRRLRVSTMSGKVSVIGHDEDTATLEVRQVEGPAVEVTWDGEQLSIKQRTPKMGIKLFGRMLGTPCSSEIVVSLPRDAACVVGTVDADVLVTQLEATCTIDSVNGEISVSDLVGDLHVDNVNGTISTARTRGLLDVDSVNGSTTCSQVSSRKIKFDAVNGNLVLDLAEVDEGTKVLVDQVNGSLMVSCPDVPLEASHDGVGGSLTVDGVPVRRHEGERRLREPGALLHVQMDVVNGSATIVRRGRTDQLPVPESGSASAHVPTAPVPQGEKS